MQGSLVGTEIHIHTPLGQSFPEVHDIALICQSHSLLLLACLQSPVDQRVELGIHLVHPTLGIAGTDGLGIDLRDDTDHAGYHRSLALSSGHSSETRTYEELAAVLRPGTGVHPGGVHHCDGRTVHDALRAYIHERARSHLPVLGDAEGVELLPMVLGRVVGNHHSVSNDQTRCVLMRREQSERMSRIQYQSLLVRHLGQILHGQTVLGPVLESRSVASIDDQLVGMLGDGHVQVIGYHQHDGRSLTAPVWKIIYTAGVYLVIGPQTVHIDTSVSLKLFLELRNEFRMMFGRKIPQRVSQCQFLFLSGKYLLSVRSMIDRRVKWFGSRKHIRDTLDN